MRTDTIANLSDKKTQSFSDRQISQQEVDQALKNWGEGLVAISKAGRTNGNAVAIAEKTINDLYNYKNGTVLFKPTLASKAAFRTTFEGALSYFVGGNENFAEDRGFALNPWIKVDFDIAGIILGDNHAIVMGDKLLTDTNGKLTRANFTMGFTKKSERLVINLHHSSLPYQPN